MTYDGLVWLSTALLVVPSLWTCFRLWQAYFKEQKAGRATSASDRRVSGAEARRLASAASLFPPLVLGALTLGLGLQVVLLVWKFCCA